LKLELVPVLSAGPLSSQASPVLHPVSCQVTQEDSEWNMSVETHSHSKS